jgi:DNA adenine methylase
MTSQMQLFVETEPGGKASLVGKQLLKWVGNKQRSAEEIATFLPRNYGKYLEPFLGSGAVLGTVAPHSAVAGDVLRPLIDIWNTLAARPDEVKEWYTSRCKLAHAQGAVSAYTAIRASYNASPNPADLLYLCRACYGGVIRFRKRDGHISTPCGVHRPISPDAFAERVNIWHRRVGHVSFVHADFETVMEMACPGDVVYCDPPYADSQAILYGAQSFSLERLYRAIGRCRDNDVRVILSVDGSKKSGRRLCPIQLPEGLFEREILLDCGRSMLRRFQMSGNHLEGERVMDRLLLTW